MNNNQKQQLYESIMLSIAKTVKHILNENHGINSMNNARLLKDDEFYTKMNECENEFKHYAQYFQNKIIYCNCDNPQFSNIVKYFKYNFNKLHIKRLYATWYGENSQIYEFDGINEIYTDIPEIHNGSFDSPQSIEILKKSDIVVTNIPFSSGLPKKFLSLMQQYNKKFITTMLTLSLCNSQYRPFIESNMFIAGFNKVNHYNRPNNVTRNKNGSVYTIWITNLPINNKRSFNFKYSYDELIKINNSEIWDIVFINGEKILYIKNKEFIPYDYKGKMLVPCSFMEIYNGNNFELISSVTSHDSSKNTNAYSAGFIIKNN